MKKIALVTGITGQDGSYLAELLLEKGYDVHGIVRRSSSSNTDRIDHILPDITLHHGDLSESCSINRLLEEVAPDELYNLAAQSHVKVSFEMPEYTGNVDGLGVIRLLDAIRQCKLDTKFYQASTSELYGKVQETPQSETTPFYPRSPYGVAKLYGYWIVRNYRESYNMFACNGILFNHTSERRGDTFVSRKITKAVAGIKNGTVDCLYIGNIDSKRDWGHARDYVEGMFRILQHDTPDDYVLASGETHTVREFIELAFKHIGIEIAWKGTGLQETGEDKETGRVLIRIDERYFRPAEVDLLLGNPTKAKNVLGWEPKITFEDLVRLMVENDI